MEIQKFDSENEPGYICYSKTLESGNTAYVALDEYDYTDKKEGNYSWKADLTQGRAIKVYLDSALAAGSYYSSMWLKHSGLNTYICQIIPSPDEAVLPFTSTSSNGNFNVAGNNTWIREARTFVNSTATTNTGTPGIRINFAQNGDGTDRTTPVTAHIDAWNFRLIPEWKTYYQNKESLVQGGKRIVRWSFDKDVDKWTCTKDLFTASGCTIDDVSVTTNATTRKTTLDVSYTMTADAATITLPEGLTDAWGREIEDLDASAKAETIKANSFTVATGAYTWLVGTLPAGSNVFVAAYDNDNKLLAVLLSDARFPKRIPCKRRGKCRFLPQCDL